MEQPKPKRDSEEIQWDYSKAQDNAKYYHDLIKDLNNCDTQYLKQWLTYWNKQLTKLLKE